MSDLLDDFIAFLEQDDQPRKGQAKAKVKKPLVADISHTNLDYKKVVSARSDLKATYSGIIPGAGSQIRQTVTNESFALLGPCGVSASLTNRVKRKLAETMQAEEEKEAKSKKWTGSPYLINNTPMPGCPLEEARKAIFESDPLRQLPGARACVEKEREAELRRKREERLANPDDPLSIEAAAKAKLDAQNEKKRKMMEEELRKQLEQEMLAEAVKNPLTLAARNFAQALRQRDPKIRDEGGKFHNPNIRRKQTSVGTHINLSEFTNADQIFAQMQPIREEVESAPRPQLGRGIGPGSTVFLDKTADPKKPISSLPRRQTRTGHRVTPFDIMNHRKKVAAIVPKLGAKAKGEVEFVFLDDDVECPESVPAPKVKGAPTTLAHKEAEKTVVVLRRKESEPAVKQSMSSATIVPPVPQKTTDPPKSSSSDKNPNFQRQEAEPQTTTKQAKPMSEAKKKKLEAIAKKAAEAGQKEL